MNSDNLSPEWRKWTDMAAAQVIRHMDGAPLVPVSYAFAAQAVAQRRASVDRRAANTARRLEASKKPTGPLSKVEAQTLAGLELDMSQSAIAKNLGVTEMQIEDAVKLLRKRGLL